MTKAGSNDDNTEDEQVTIEVAEIKSPDGGWGWVILFGFVFIRIIAGESVKK